MTLPKPLNPIRSAKGAAHGRIRALEKELGVALPDEYVALLLESDGFDGVLRNDKYVVFSAVSQLTGERLPDAVLIGSNGGADAYGVRTRDGCVEYFVVPFVEMTPDACRVLGGSFAEFIENLASDETRSTPERRVACLRCGQDWLRRVRLRFLNREIVLCQECDAMWPGESDIGQTTFEDYSTFMERNGRASPQSPEEFAVEGFVVRRDSR